MISTTIGLYANGEYVVNGVSHKDLAIHIAYNKSFRPGRALIVDGVCVHTGYLSSEDCADFIATVAHSITMTKCTAPYR